MNLSFDEILHALEQERLRVDKDLGASQSLPLTCGACCPLVVGADGDGAAPLAALADSLARIETQLSLRKKIQSSSPTKATTIRTATKKKTTVAILQRNGSKKEAR
jgi:hypothetical protein